MANELEQLVLKKAQSWLDGHYDEATKKQVKYLMDNDMKELVESFYKDLEFGTGGLRGIMGVGSNRMNVYTVGAATQGLSNYLKKNFAGERVRVAVAHDSRNNSRMFAERVADIFASNGFQVFLFDALRPTPELSFAIRELKCHSGVVVTASHNPKEYNGYKAYWTDGAQVTEPHDKNIIAEVAKITDVDMENKKISLGYKKTEDNPWEVLKRDYEIGSVVTAKVVSMTAFGAFAQIIPGVDGLIHISQISNERINKPQDVLTIGQEVQVQITDIDFDKKRVSLSMKALLDDSAEEAAEEVSAEDAE